jgi:hypothetical protein
MVHMRMVGLSWTLTTYSSLPMDSAVALYQWTTR